MPFTQTMTVRTSNLDQLRSMMQGWHDEQHGVAPGYQGARLLADRDDANRVVIEVDFSSFEEAQANNDRPDTKAWASRLQELAEGEPEYGNFELAFSTD